MRRSVWSVVAVLIIVAMIVGCVPKPAASTDVAPTQAPAESTMTAEAPEPAGPTIAPERAEPYQVLFWEHSPWTRAELPEKEDDFTWQYIRDNYNLDITLQVAPAGAEADVKLNAMIAAGEIPDFIEAQWPVGSPIVRQYIDQGILIPVDDYIKDMPYLTSYLSEDALSFVTLDDKQYAIAQPLPLDNWDTVWIRKDWLDAVGLPIPTTIDELAEAAKAFTTQDPDGDGQDDTYGFTAMSNFDLLQSVFAPFGAYPGRNNIRIEDNQVIFDAFSPEMKEALAWWKAQVDAGVVDPNWTTNSRENWREAVAQGKAGIVTAEFQMLRFCSNLACLGEAIQAASPEAEWIQLPALEGPFGTYVSWQRGLIGMPFWFTRQAESEPGKMEALMRFFNDAMNPESELYEILVYGIEGVTYVADENGRRIENITPPEMAWRSYWAVFRRGDLDYFWTYKTEQEGLFEKMEFSTSQPKIKNVTLLVTAHEAWPDLLIYLQEMHMKFATGEEPLDKWDEFINTAMAQYRLQEVLDDATAQLQKKGLIQ